MARPLSLIPTVIMPARPKVPPAGFAIAEGLGEIAEELEEIADAEREARYDLDDAEGRDYARDYAELEAWHEHRARRRAGRELRRGLGLTPSSRRRLAKATS